MDGGVSLSAHPRLSQLLQNCAPSCHIQWDKTIHFLSISPFCMYHFMSLYIYFMYSRIGSNVACCHNYGVTLNFIHLLILNEYWLHWFHCFMCMVGWCGTSSLDQDCSLSTSKKLINSYQTLLLGERWGLWKETRSMLAGNVMMITQWVAANYLQLQLQLVSTLLCHITSRNVKTF